MFVALCLPTVSRAESATDLANLLAKIKSLQEQLASIQNELKESIVLANDLKEGMTSDEVRALQEVLATDPSIYPANLNTGYFGPLTKEALRKYQIKHGILGEDGRVGMKTRAVINGEVSKEEFRCKAWGQMIAPGQLKKRLGKVEFDLSRCGKVPQGILNQLNTSNVISDISGKGIVISKFKIEVSDDEAEIKFNTNKPTKATLWFETGATVDKDDSESLVHSAFKTEHEFKLKNLTSNSRHSFVIDVSDRAGNTLSTGNMAFATDSNADNNDDSDDDDDDNNGDDHGGDDDEDDD